MTVQLSLPGQAHVAEGPIDHNGMYVMHFAFRRDLADLVGAAARTPVEDNATWTKLRDYFDLFAELLHHHHTAEDAHLWPALAGAVGAHGTPADRSCISAMEDEHAAIGPALDRCRQGLQALLADPSLSRRDDLHGRLADARDIIEGHMSHEESETLPLVSRVMDPATYAEVERRVGRSYPLRIVATLVPWAFHGLPADDAQQLLELAPPPHRLLLRLTRRRFARRHRATFVHLGSR